MEVRQTPPVGKGLSTETGPTVKDEPGGKDRGRPDHGSAVSCPPLLVSACLVGLRTRLDGSVRSFPAVMSLASRFCLIPVCPEQLGGLTTPRPGAELCGGAGVQVLGGTARVMTAEGVDVTDAFVRGAAEVLAIARLTGAAAAVLKARSPSCGVGTTYDGTFAHALQQGSGVTAALLESSGIALFTEEDCAGLGAGSDDGEPQAAKESR
jgi:uncharacterized protein YbbK (DUF523 family)